jgi:hypothetical protein
VPPFLLPPSNSCSMRRKERDVDVARAEIDLNGLIERRARQRSEANASEMMWKESVRRHHVRLRRERRAEWFAHFSCLASSLRASADEFGARAEALLEEPGEGGGR